MFIAPPSPPPIIPQPITIWVHGTRPDAIFPFFAQDENTQKPRSGNPKELKPLKELKATGKTTALLTALFQGCPNLFTKEAIYSFAWSGDLSVAARKTAAQRLYDSIKKIVNQAIKKYGIAPPVSVISHSHGGNVILHMADYAHENAFTIQRTILLACPVQKETAQLAQSAFFGTVYSIHSHVDMVQIMEPQRLQPYKTAFALFQETKSFELLKEAYTLSLNQPLFSERHFNHSQNIIQANIMWQSAAPSADDSKTTNKIELFFHEMASKVMSSRRGVLHTEFITPTFMRNIGNIITNLDNHRIVHGIVSDDIELFI